MFRRGRLRYVSWQGLDRSSQNEPFQFRSLLALPSESESTLRGRPGHSAITSVISGDGLSVKDVGHETGWLNTNGPAELHAFLKPSEDRRGKDVLGTLLPGGNRTTGLNLRAEDEANEYVQTAEREEEEGGDEGEAVDVVGENCCSNQTLKNTKSADAEVVSKDRKKLFEKDRGPPDFGQEENDDLSDNQKSIEDGPEDAGGLVGDGRVRDVIVTEHRRVTGRERVWAIGVVLVCVEGLNVLDECHDAAPKDEDEGDDAKSSNNVQPNEHISSRWKHGCR